jgi:PAS domain S-box-containing protein
MSGKTLLSRVVMVVVIALLPGLALQVYTERQDRLTRQNIMQNQAMRLLGLVSDAEQRIADGSALVLDSISAAPAVQDLNPAACRRLMENLVATAPRYGFAALIAPDGHIVCGSRTGDPGITALDRPYFQRAMQTGAFAVGDYAVGRGTGKPSLHFAQPVRDARGAITGIVMVSLRLAWLQTQLEGLALPEGTIAAITDRNGIVLGRIPYEAARIGQPLRPETRLVLQGTANRIDHITDRQGRDRLIAYAPPGAGPARLAVLVALDAQTAFASITQGNRFRLTLIVISSLFALLLTGVFGRRLINRPVARLLQTAERWRAGDLAARSELAQDRSEFGRLATAFDSMAATLQAREHALNMALESTTDYVIVLDRDWRYVYMNAAAKALNGRDLTGRIMWEASPEGIGTPIAASLHEAVNTGKPTQVEGYVITQKRYLQVNAYPFDGGLTVYTRDLTEERRTAAALRDSEARLQLAREAAGFGIWERDYAAGTRAWSEDQWRLFGLTPQQGGPEDAAYNALIHPDDLEPLLAFRQSMRAGEADRGTTEYRVVWPDGSVHWLNDKVKMLRAPDGTLQRAVGVTLDVTERREAEEELRLTTERFQMAIESSPISLFCQDRELRYTWVYNTHRSFNAGAMIGCTDRDIVHRPADADITEAIKREAMRTGARQRRQVAVLVDGAELQYDLLVEPMRDRAGRIEGVRCASIDITEQKRIEARLREVTAELHEANRIARLGNWQYDVARNESHVSEEVRRILGFGSAAQVPRRSEQRGSVYPDQAWQKVNAAIEGALATGQGFALDVPAQRASEAIWVNIRGEPIVGPDGSVTGLRGTLQDITERRRLEEELRSLTKTLEQRIEQEVAAREAAQSRAAQAERIQALGQLAGGIAHDFNNVLQATLGALSLIERRPDDRDGIRRIARMAAQACERGAAITRRLLGFARRGELRAGRVEIAGLLAGLQEILAHTLGAAIEVHVAVADPLAPAFVDRSQLETVLVNLATNARDAMPGGGRLIFSANAEVLSPDDLPHPSGLTAGGYIRLAVTDTGQGMDAATLARAAEPFFTTKGHGDGTGLGLSMAKGFAEQSGGAFAIASTPGHGTTITLWLPEAAADTLALTPVHGDFEESCPGAASHRKLVLLVDDQDSVREILAAQLNDAGFDVVPAAGGAHAISLLGGGLCVDALVTDLSMPQVDGLAVIKAAQQRLPRLPAILLTGYAGDDAALAVSGAISGTFSLLRKPVDDAQLIDRLRTLLAAGAGEDLRPTEEKAGLLF